MKENLKEKKIRKVPSKSLVWFFRMLMFLSIAGLIVSTILMFTSDFGGDMCDYAFGGFFLFMGLSFVLMFPVWILESLTKTKGRTLCYFERRTRTDCDSCLECTDCCSRGGGFGFFLSLTFLLLGKHKTRNKILPPHNSRKNI